MASLVGGAALGAVFGEILEQLKSLSLSLTAPGGCGKTILVKMLGHDQEIKEFCLEKLKFDMPNYNILVTSRTALPGYSFTYNLKPLNDEDATTLLRHSASLQDGISHISVEIVRGCGGFPLALKVNGKSLCGMPVEAWRGRGSFREDQRIPVLALIDVWQELYKHDEDGIDAIAILHELTSRNLANLVMTRSESTVIQRISGDIHRELYAPFVGGAFPEATFGEVFEVLHDTVKNVGSKVLAFKSF
nr:putative disease resistance protein [Quercus suber]